MIACPKCGFEAPDDFAFCPKCATALISTHAAPEERKVVTTLFCDLVAFTAMSEQADPEDVDAVLRSYHAAARKVIESHGGTVEKFIGDAVVGVFGVPSVHEDDPERAVRAGLRIVEALEGMTRPDGSPLQVRVGVNTGEALVRLDVTPGSGEGFLTGDAVNVAARLQAAAPPGGVAAGQVTHVLTVHEVVYEALAPVLAKGKSEPIPVWIAKAPVARMGAIMDRAGLTPLVGRQLELAYLDALFAKAISTSAAQFALVVGEPGIGKSRLVSEMLAHVDARSEMITWRQGRCLPYGEGITFWALAEIVKAHAGVLETDSTSQVESKLSEAVADGPDGDWMVSRLRALVGLEAPPATRDENFAAWLRFLEQLALAEPLVLVFEDLHWADDGLLAFIEHLATHVDSVPLMAIGTARPELFERHPAFAAGSSNLNRLALAALTRQECEEMVINLAGGARALDQRVADIVERCEGNPFYAEESARLLTDQMQGASIPASVQAVVAARLDGLPAEQKAVLCDAAVVGDVFWNGAVAALGRCHQDVVDVALRELVAKQLVRRVRDSSMSGENEFAFVHALAREVAYGQLPRTARATKHAEAATWLEGVAADRVEDLAESLALHCSTAFDLLRASGEAGEAETAAARAVRYLEAAGDRSLSLDAALAERHYAHALLVAGEGSPQRPALLHKWATVLNVLATRDEEAIEALTESIPGLLAQGEVRDGAVAMTLLAFFYERRCEPVWDMYLEADELLRDDDPSPELVTVLTRAVYARWWLDLGNRRLVLPDFDRAVDIASNLGMPDPVEALSWRGVLRCSLGDVRGLDDSRRAVESARAQGLGREFVGSLFSHALLVECEEGPQAILSVLDEARGFCERRGMHLYADWIRACAAEPLSLLGAWDEALAEVAATAPRLEEAGDAMDAIQVRSQQAVLWCWLGSVEDAAKVTSWLEARAGQAKAIGLESYCLMPTAFVKHMQGDDVAAMRLLSGIEILHGMNPDARYAELLTEGMRVALACDGPETAARLIDGVEPVAPLYAHILATGEALLAEARGEHEAAGGGFADAAERWHDFGVPYEEGHALCGQGRCLVALGRAPEAAAPLAAAREIFARLGARPALAETDEWLAKAGAGGDRAEASE